MAVIEGGTSGTVMEVGVASAAAAHVQVKPIPHGSLGHYRSAARFVMLASQGATSRLWEVRNTSTNLLVPTRLRVQWVQTAAHTAAIRDSIQLYRATSFSAVDTTNTQTPAGSVRRTTGMAAFPGGAALRALIATGNASGMTGGTVTLDSGPAGILETWLLAAVPTAGPTVNLTVEFLDDVNGTHPFVLAQNEGLVLVNEVALGAAAGSEVMVDFSWAEVTAY